MTDTREAFIRAMQQVPGAVAIIATCHAGERGGLTATAWSSVTADPPTLLACVNRAASAHALFLESCVFSINLLATSDVETAALFSAQRFVDGDARFSASQWAKGAQDVPIFKSAVAAFECRLTGKVAQGTHTILFGEVHAVRWRSDVDALVYVRRGFALATVLTEGTP